MVVPISGLHPYPYYYYYYYYYHYYYHYKTYEAPEVDAEGRSDVGQKHVPAAGRGDSCTSINL